MKRPKAVLALFWYAVIWGSVTLILAVVADWPSKTIALLTAVSGAGMVALAFGVWCGKTRAAWLLLGCAVLDLLARAKKVHSGYLMPLILLVLALLAALSPKEKDERQ